MAGTYEGGQKAAVTNKSRYGENFYTVIGRKGGQISRGGGFKDYRPGSDGLTGYERAVEAGRKGGKASRRGKDDLD